MEASNKSFFSCRELKISQMIQTNTACNKAVLVDTQRCQMTGNSRDCRIWKKVLRSYTTNNSSFGFNKKSDYFQPEEKFLRGKGTVLFCVFLDFIPGFCQLTDKALPFNGIPFFPDNAIPTWY